MNALQFTGSGANITERYQPERRRYDLLKMARILQDRMSITIIIHIYIYITIHGKNDTYRRNREVTKPARYYDKRCRLQKR